MNGHQLNPSTLNTHLDFLRKQKGEYQEKRDNLKNSPGARSDDADTLLRGYEAILNQINYLISYTYDCENQHKNFDKVENEIYDTYRE